MQMQTITAEQFADIYNELGRVQEHKPSPAIVAYSGEHIRLGNITIISEPTHCLLLRA
jgi:hypothetical protein